VNRLKHLGLRKVEGSEVVDDSYFEGVPYAEGLEEDASDGAYMAPAGAFSIGFNTITVHIRPHHTVQQPAHITLDPVSHNATLTGSINTVSHQKTRLQVGISPLGKAYLVRVSGVINIDEDERIVWRKIEHPSWYAGSILKEFLQNQGIAVEGDVKVEKAPTDTPLMYTYHSPALHEIIGSLNRFSNNFVANQIAFAAGAHVLGPPASWEKGQQVIADYLEKHVGLDQKSYVLANASGLHSVNRMSAFQLVKILEHMHHNPQTGPEFISSLAVAGHSGTLRKRMRGTAAEGRLRAKTGTLSSASALAGYVTTQDGDLLAFAFIVNAPRIHASHIHTLQDTLGVALAELKNPSP
jgi:D-alanyl-D-alanine carboxypeptidase/D-alanyl-D-alanine-endopeptidase (penicillin-binding protein 4)